MKIFKRRFRMFFAVAALPFLGLGVLMIMKARTKQDFVIIYDPGYNITLLGLEKLHPFDSGKYGRVFALLQEKIELVEGQRWLRPEPATEAQLLLAHSDSYLKTLERSATVARYTELAFLSALPAGLVRARVLEPMRLATGGTILATREALARDLAINLGGGYHHASRETGGGFCIYADITVAVRLLFEEGRVERVMIVDLDAHQGNGCERDFLGDDRVFIFDMYNSLNYPYDEQAKAGIDHDLPLQPGVGDEEYLALLSECLPDDLASFKPDLLIFNAGTDVYENDPLGGLALTREGIIARDEFVIAQARQLNIPCAMLLSGGYTRASAGIIADSLLNFLR